MGFCLQLVVILIFAGFFIGTIDRVGVGGAEYINHNSETGRNPELHCPTDAATSILCLFAPTMLSQSETDSFATAVNKVGVFNSMLTAYKGMKATNDIIKGAGMMSNALVKKTGRDAVRLGKGIASVGRGFIDDITRVDDGEGGKKLKMGENWKNRYNNWKVFEGIRTFAENQRDKKDNHNEHKYAKLWARRLGFRHDIKNNDE